MFDLRNRLTFVAAALLFSGVMACGSTAIDTKDGGGTGGMQATGGSTGGSGDQVAGGSGGASGGSGGSSSGGSGATGGSGGSGASAASDGGVELDAALSPDAPSPDAGSPSDSSPFEMQGLKACQSLGILGMSEVETKFIGPRCGTATCHNTMSPFPPRQLDVPSMLRERLVDKKSLLFCKNDLYINRADPWKSVVLATVWTVEDRVTCPSGGLGGSRMPNKDGMPTILAPRLSQAELDCFTWWVFQVAKE